jgi:virginiamycin B lyase
MLAAGLLISAAGLVLPSGYALAAAGHITEYPVPTAASAPSAITAGPDGNLWFTEDVANKVAKVTKVGAFTEYPIPTANSAPGGGIAAGPDGNLWFTEYQVNKVAKVTTSGAFTEYPIPTADSGPSGVVAGPDGNLWFTEGTVNQVGKITTSGAFTEYPIPTANNSSFYIAAGPDGNLWFTEPDASQIGKVTTSGAFTEYPVPTANSSPNDIVAGPDGNLWFTESAINVSKVAKVTTSGAFTEYPTPTASSLPYGIAAGPDGNLWFTEFNVSKVAKVTTSGTFTEYPIPTANSSPAFIAAGPDGNLWFTEGVNKVAKIDAHSNLRVTSSPPVPTQILVDGQISDFWGLTWLQEPPGNHTVCFTHAEGWTEPPCQTAIVNPSDITTMTGNFIQRGELRVITSPAVNSQISVDGNPTAEFGMWTDVPTGSHTVCFGKVAGYNPPACQTATVSAGTQTTITGTFTTNPSAVGQSGVGLLRATTSPAVPSQITIKPSMGSIYIADTWGLSWLELPPGSYTVSFTHVPGYTEPAPQTLTITSGMTTTVTGTFIQRGFLRVITSPPADGTLSVDGIPRDNWGDWTDYPTGSHMVCFGAAPGYANTPACQTVTVSAGVETDVTGTYS